MNRALPWPILIPLAVGVAALVLSLARLGWAPAAFFRSYLPACLFWIGIPVGSLALLMIHGLTGGAWGGFMRPVLAAGAGVLPLNALLFIPLAFGLPELYPWAAPGWHPEGVTGGQAVWLRPGFFLIREAVVLAVWVGLAAIFWNPLPLGAGRARGSQQNFTSLNSSLSVSATDVEGTKSHLNSPHPNPPPLGEGVRSAFGLIVYGLTVTVFGIDWVMSLEPRWASTNIGFLSAVSFMLAALAFGTAVLCVRARDGRYPPGMAAARFGDLGGLLLAFVLLWGYLAFQQYLTVWSENLPDRSIWYVQRNRDGWRAWSWALAAVGGALPFVLLLSRDLKRDPRRLVWAAGLVLAGSLLDAYWQVMPGFHSTPGNLSLLDALPFIGIGGVWLAAFLWRLAGLETETSLHG